MSRQQTARYIEEMLNFFLQHCGDHSTLSELYVMSRDAESWCRGHELHGRIREKSQIAERSGDLVGQAQYSFEEYCAKTFYNLSDAMVPFSEDTPFWIIPQGFRLARQLRLENPYAFTSLLSDECELGTKFM
jgi:hypothetical protein